MLDTLEFPWKLLIHIYFTILYIRIRADPCGCAFRGDRALARILGSIPGGYMDVCLLWVLCVVGKRSLRWADHPSRWVLPSVVYLSVIVKRRK